MSALHGLVILYEKQFQIAALRNTEGERTAATNLSTSVTPTGWIHVSIEPEIETSFEADAKSANQPSNMNFQPLHAKPDSPPSAFMASSGSNGSRFADSCHRTNSNLTPPSSSSSPSSLSFSSGRNFYTHVWKSMIFLASDPHPSVARMAQHVIHSVHDKVSYFNNYTDVF